MAIWLLKKQVGSGNAEAQVGDTFKLVRIRDTVEDTLDEYTVPDLPFIAESSVMHFRGIIHTGQVERDDLTPAQRDAIDDDDDTTFTKLKPSGEPP